MNKALLQAHLEFLGTLDQILGALFSELEQPQLGVFHFLENLHPGSKHLRLNLVELNHTRQNLSSGSKHHHPASVCVCARARARAHVRL